MLQKEQAENEQRNANIATLNKVIEEAQTELAKIESEIRENEELQRQDQERDEYLQVRSHLE
jgi:hypothetical protein